jgi:ornithine--oxo-acid transaminase
MSVSKILSDYRENSTSTYTLAENYLNPNWVKVLRILNMDKSFTKAQGSYLFDAEGNRYLDMHSGEGVASLGHNNPEIRTVLKEIMDEELVNGIQTHYSALSGMLARELTEILPNGLDAVFFTNSGAETVDTAMKFARSATKRPRLLSCERAFHGLSLGPLSLAGEDYFKEGFGPLLSGCTQIPFGDLDRLDEELRHKNVAAFICEPIQGRTVAVPENNYFSEVQRLCRKYGTLFIMDEIQTGLGRTGKMFALEHWGLEPDMVLIAKTLSGGFIPVGAMITRRKIYNKVLNTLERSYVHHSTYGRNSMAMAAGLASVRILRQEDTLKHINEIGQQMLHGLKALQSKYEMVADVRGRGLMVGIEFGPPKSMKLRLNWNLIHAASEGLFAQLVVIPLLKSHRIISMVSGHNDVIKFLPPYTLTSEDVDYFLDAMNRVLEDAHSGASNNWKIILDLARSTASEKISGLGRRVNASPVTST